MNTQFKESWGIPNDLVKWTSENGTTTGLNFLNFKRNFINQVKSFGGRLQFSHFEYARDVDLANYHNLLIDATKVKDTRPLFEQRVEFLQQLKRELPPGSHFSYIYEGRGHHVGMFNHWQTLPINDAHMNITTWVGKMVRRQLNVNNGFYWSPSAKLAERYLANPQQNPSTEELWSRLKPANKPRNRMKTITDLLKEEESKTQTKSKKLRQAKHHTIKL